MPKTFIGTEQADTLIGSWDNDTFIGNAGNDTFYGNGGDDRFDAGAGRDTMVGGWGRDTMLGGSGDDTAYAQGGNDYVEGGEGSDLIYGGDGEDILYGDAPGIVTRAGVSYDDLIESGSGNDRAYGGLGNDEIQGEGGDDYIVGGRDDGRLVYAPGGDTKCLDALIDFKDGSTVTLDLHSVQNSGGNLTVSLHGERENITAGAISLDVNGHAFTTFCVQLPEWVYYGRNEGYTVTGADEAFALSDHFMKNGVAPGLNDVKRDLVHERAEVNLAKQLVDALGGDGCHIQGLIKAGQQDQLAFEGGVHITAAQSTAAQLLLWEIAYDFDGKSLSSMKLDTGEFRAQGDALTPDVLKAYDALVGKLSLEAPAASATDAAHPLQVVIGDNLYGNDGHDTFAFARGDGVDMIWDFQAGQDVVELHGFRMADVNAYTFVTDVVDQGRDGMHPLNGGTHQKLAMILDRNSDAIVFNDVGDRNSTAAAVKFDDGTMSIKDMWAKAAAAQAPAPAAEAPMGDIAAAVKVTGAWWGGFQGEITVTARHGITDWDVTLGTKWNVQNVWNGQRDETSVDGHGSHIHIEDAGWNGHLSEGQTATIGFTASTGVNGEMAVQQIMDGLWIG